MNDIVVTYDSKFNTEKDLRQVLRAIESKCEGFNEIVLIGDKPDWIQGVVHIGYSNADRETEHKVRYMKLKVACVSDKVTPSFYWMDAGFTPVCFDATKATRIANNGNTIVKGVDKITLSHTLKLMSRRGFYSQGIYFNKFPMGFSKKRLMNTFDDVDFETKFGYCIKTLYVNFNRLSDTKTPLKTIKQQATKSSYERF